MIDSTHRFHGRSSLQFVYKRGRIVRNQLCSMRYIVNNRQSNFRVAVVVSRKVNKSAVVRNRLRRRIYEAVRLRSPAIDKPFDMVITAYSDQLADIESAKLEEIVDGLLQGAEILSNITPSDDKLHAIVKAKEQTG